MCSVILGLSIVLMWTGRKLGLVWYMDQAQSLVGIISIYIDAVIDVLHGWVPVEVERVKERNSHDFLITRST